MLQTVKMQKWIPSVAYVFGFVGMLGISPLPVHLLQVHHEVLPVVLAVLVSRLDDTTVLFQNHEGTFCKDL
jgi:hypothetical protein